MSRMLVFSIAMATIGLTAAKVVAEEASPPVEGASPTSGDREEAEDVAEAEDDAGTDTVDPEVRAVRTRARLHFERGLQLFRSEHWEAALTEFEASIAALPNRSALYNRGLCLRNLYRYPEAIAALDEYLDYLGDNGETAHLAEVRDLRAAMRELLTPVDITVDIEGATIIVDGEVRGESPLAEPFLLLSGPHDVVVRAPGYVRESREIRVVSGREASLSIELREEPRRGRVQVDSNVAGALVYVDGEIAGEVGAPLLLEAGNHRIGVRAPGWREVERSLLVEADREHEIALSMSRPFRFHRAWFWSSLGLTIAGFLTTVGLGANVVVLNQDYDPNGPTSTEDHPIGRAWMQGTDAALGVTLFAAAASLVFGLLGDWPESVDDELEPDPAE